MPTSSRINQSIRRHLNDNTEKRNCYNSVRLRFKYAEGTRKHYLKGIVVNNYILHKKLLLSKSTECGSQVTFLFSISNFTCPHWKLNTLNMTGIFINYIKENLTTRKTQKIKNRNAAEKQEQVLCINKQIKQRSRKDRNRYINKRCLQTRTSFKPLYLLGDICQNEISWRN